MRKVVALAAFAAITCIATGARADAQTFNAEFFKPATGRNPYLMLQGIDTLHKYQFQVGEFFSYGYRPLEVTLNNQRITGVIDHLLVSDFVAAFGITEWMQIGVDFPFVLLNRFQDPNVAPPPGYSTKMSLGDLRVEAKARVLDACKFPVGLAFIPYMTVPTGKDEYFVGDPGLTGGLIISTEGRVTRRFALTGNVGFKAGRRVNFRNIDWQYRLLLGLGGYFQFGKGLSVFGEVNSESAFEHFWNNRDMNMAEGMVGVKWDIKKTGVKLNAGVGSCFICGVKGALARSVLGVTYRWNPPKYQKLDDDFGKVCDQSFQKGLTAQQYYDLRLKCPPDPKDFRQGVDDDACPKYYELREVAELLWRCPPKAEDFKAGVHDDACQKVYTLMDQYTEAEIWTAYTLAAAEMGARCPPSPAQFNPLIHDQACPKYFDLREISMLSQVCPDDPSKFRQGVDDDSCPKYYTLRDQYPEAQWSVVTLLSGLDTDKDRINDYLDVCPERPEDYNGFADADGCPDGGVAAVVGGEILTYRPVYFEFAQYNLTAEAMQVLDLVIGVINRDTWIKRVRVAGNADAIGSPAANIKLSQRRAEAAIAYLRSHGVRSGVQLIPVAYGASKPVASNDTEAGRALNRRVSFGVDSGARRPYYPPRTAPAYRPPTQPVRTAPQPVPVAAPAPTPPAPSPAPQSQPTGVPQRWEY